MDRGERPPRCRYPREHSPQCLRIKDPDRGKICVLLRKWAQSASCLHATVPAEQPGSLPGQLCEEPLDAEDTEDSSQRAAEGGCAAPARLAPSDWGERPPGTPPAPKAVPPKSLQHFAASSNRLGAPSLRAPLRAVPLRPLRQRLFSNRNSRRDAER